MFAGKMRLRTFLILAAVGSVICGGGVVLVSGGTLVALQGSSPPAAPPEAASALPSPPPSASAAATPSARPWDSLILSRNGQDLRSDKIKDASKSESYKVNLYQDAGFSVMNRAKVDYDRDEKWDEKWTFAPDGSIELEVAPNDDENYTQTLVYRVCSWIAK